MVFITTFSRDCARPSTVKCVYCDNSALNIWLYFCIILPKLISSWRCLACRCDTSYRCSTLSLIGSRSCALQARIDETSTFHKVPQRVAQKRHFTILRNEETRASRGLSAIAELLVLTNEWVSSFLTAHQHIIGQMSHFYAQVKIALLTDIDLIHQLILSQLQGWQKIQGSKGLQIWGTASRDCRTLRVLPLGSPASYRPKCQSSTDSVNL